MRRAKVYEENGGYIVMIRDGGAYYDDNSEKHVFTDLDKALTLVKEFMTKPKKEKAKKARKKKTTKVAPH